jgi:hypothetical protein
MNTARLRRLETILPAKSNAGIALFCGATMFPVALIAVCLRVLG